MHSSRTPGTGPPRILAEIIHHSFHRYLSTFRMLTQKARSRFIHQQWGANHEDARRRLYIYKTLVQEAITDIGRELGPMQTDNLIWEQSKGFYRRLILHDDTCELAGTFFNSVVRKVIGTVGVNPSVEFTTEPFMILMLEDRRCPVCNYFIQPEGRPDIRDLVHDILASYCDSLPFEDITGDARKVAARIKASLRSEYGSSTIRNVEMLSSVFYRDMAAYLIGRMRVGERIVPLAIAVLKTGGAVGVDAVMLTEAEVSILFSFARSYFQVDVTHPKEMVNFLKTILPLKRVSEIYTSIGFYKHGKAELYRELVRALQHPSDQFEIAPGKKGMVMAAFTIPSLDVVFKVIRDTFEYPKQTSRQEVRDMYELVFSHHRAGRLIDAQEFNNIRFARSRFSKVLLDELADTASQNIVLTANAIVIKHLYIERRLVPLDLYIQTAPEFLARKVILDYGQAIKDLAVSNIFPGDLFLKNFGVTRHGRVVFYDFDEISLITDCKFKKIPPPRMEEDLLSDEVWFAVAEQDVFPEEFPSFIGIPPELRPAFEAKHADLFTAEYWQAVQESLKSGTLIQVVPYRESCRV